MAEFIRWLIGFVSFSFSSGFCEGFVNDCFKKKYNIQNIEVENGILRADCPAALYLYLRKIAKKNGGRLKIVKKHGLVFILERVKNRWGIFAGIVLGIIFISFITGFVWNIEITGNSRLSDGEVRSFLAQNGFSEGAYMKSVDKGKIENLLLSSFDDIAWAHINTDGTSARVEINESVKRPKTVSRKDFANLKAKKDGVIVRVAVYDGWARANRGDAVKKGDLLISGVYSGEKKTAQFTHARGEYIAQVKEDFSLVVNRQQSRKIYLSETKRKTLLFFGLEIPLYIGKTAENSEVENVYKYIKMNNKSLPVGIKKSAVREYKNETVTLSDSELADLAYAEVDKKLKEDFKNYGIAGKSISVSLCDSSAEAKGYVLCLENIGKEEKIKLNSSEN